MVEARTRAPRKSTPSHTSVLVVERDRAVREAVRDVLQMRGYFVRAVASREDALAHLAGMRFDLVVTDVALVDDPANGDVAPRTVLVRALPDRYVATSAKQTLGTLHEPYRVQTIANWLADVATHS
jgi:DNA-binding NarL/FixJ family response regulator